MRKGGGMFMLTAVKYQAPKRRWSFHRGGGAAAARATFVGLEPKISGADTSARASAELKRWSSAGSRFSTRWTRNIARYRWNTKSCSAAASRGQTASATKPSRRPPLQRSAAKARQPQQQTPSASQTSSTSQNTKPCLKKSSPAFRKPKRTWVRTGLGRVSEVCMWVGSIIHLQCSDLQCGFALLNESDGCVERFNSAVVLVCVDCTIKPVPIHQTIHIQNLQIR